MTNQFEKAQSGDMVGCSVVEVDLPYMIQLHRNCVGAVYYEMGAKPPFVLKVPIGTDRCDCSGYLRWLLYHATRGKLLLPDGSWNEYAALLGDGFKPSMAANTALHDNHVRTNIHVADDKDRTGHIWITVNGRTYECYGGHGVGSRSWDAMLSSGYRLSQLITHCYVLC